MYTCQSFGCFGYEGHPIPFGYGYGHGYSNAFPAGADGSGGYYPIVPPASIVPAQVSVVQARARTHAENLIWKACHKISLYVCACGWVYWYWYWYG